MVDTKGLRLSALAVCAAALGLFGFWGDCGGGGNGNDVDSPRDCWALGERACRSADICAPIYVPGPEGREFDHCEPLPHEGPMCRGLDERHCMATRGCEPVYGGTGCACAPCPVDEAGNVDPNCPPCDCPPNETFYDGCRPVDHGCLSDADCGRGMRCDLPLAGGTRDPATGGAPDEDCVCDSAGICECGDRCIDGDAHGVCVPAGDPDPCNACPDGTMCQEHCRCAESCDDAGNCERQCACATTCDPAPVCREGSVCADGSVCVNGQCGGGGQPCREDSQCGDGRVCHENHCVEASPPPPPPTAACAQTSDCPEDHLCRDGHCLSCDGSVWTHVTTDSGEVRELCVGPNGHEMPADCCYLASH